MGSKGVGEKGTYLDRRRAMEEPVREIKLGAVPSRGGGGGRGREEGGVLGFGEDLVEDCGVLGGGGGWGGHARTE